MTLQDEISHFLKLHEKKAIILTLEEQHHLQHPSSEVINQQLDSHNERLIRKQIDIKSTELDLADIGITRFPGTLFEDPDLKVYWQTLTHLFCAHNKLMTLDLSACRALRVLSCAKNCLTSLNLANCRALEVLWCHHNSLDTLVLEGPSLTILACQDNALTRLDLQNCPTLEWLSCNGNKLTELYVKSTTLLSLYCYNNPLAELNLSHCPAVEKIECDPNQTVRLVEPERWEVHTLEQMLSMPQRLLPGTLWLYEYRRQTNERALGSQERQTNQSPRASSNVFLSKKISHSA